MAYKVHRVARTLSLRRKLMKLLMKKVRVNKRNLLINKMGNTTRTPTPGVGKTGLPPADSSSPDYEMVAHDTDVKWSCPTHNIWCPILTDETDEPWLESATNVAMSKHIPDAPCEATFYPLVDRTSSDTLLAKMGPKDPHELMGTCHASIYFTPGLIPVNSGSSNYENVTATSEGDHTGCTPPCDSHNCPGSNAREHIPDGYDEITVHLSSTFPALMPIPVVATKY